MEIWKIIALVVVGIVFTVSIFILFCITKSSSQMSRKEEEEEIKKNRKEDVK